MYLVSFCCSIGAVTALEKVFVAVTTENLTFNVRRDLLRGIIFKQVQWFDRESRAPGILTNVLSEDVQSLHGMTTETIAVTVEAGMGMLLGFIYSASIAWKMACITFALSPVMLIGIFALGRLQWNDRGGKTKDDKLEKLDEYQKSNALLSDVIVNYRTVICFGQSNVDALVSRFGKLLEEPSRKKVKNAQISGLLFGYSNSARMLFLGITFYVGSFFVDKKGELSKDIYLSIFIIFMTCTGSGLALSNMPSISKAKSAASNIFAIIDEPSTLDVRETSVNKIS